MARERQLRRAAVLVQVSSPGPICRVEASDYPQLIEVWTASIRAQRQPMSEAYLALFMPLARDAWLQLVDLACVRDARGAAVGFVGVAEGRIEVLLVHPAYRRAGRGGSLVRHAVERLGATEVEVDERNEPLLRFYRREGFEVASRSHVVAFGQRLPQVRLRLRARSPARGAIR